ncbi:hypothetical protein OG21DRAFT_1457811 [Imleria badia]|nr:hypothetical protein OG21DRAFT_1457811 [Imleria badia]
MSEAPYILHIWPSKWNLQSLDPTCLAAVMYLQLTIPGKFKVAPCTNPDKSPNGQLPFLTHAHTAVATFPSIVAFVAALAKQSASGAIDLDVSLTSSQKAEKVALYAHVEACISDIVSHMFYGIDANFWELTNPALASEMHVPQKYYVASRIRETYRPRLEAAGLWSLPAAEEEQKGLFEKDKKKKRDYTVTFSRAFEREKILDKAKTALGVHASYLDGKQFFFGDRQVISLMMLARSPTSLDVYLAAHILLLADPPFPDAVLQIHLIACYEGLIEHARRIRAEVARAPPYEYFTASETLLSSFVPRSFSGNRAQTQIDPADVQYRRRTLAFVAAALAMTAVYMYTLVSFVQVSAKASEDNGEGSEEGGGDSEGEDGGEEELASSSGAFTEDEDS